MKVLREERLSFDSNGVSARVMTQARESDAEMSPPFLLSLSLSAFGALSLSRCVRFLLSLYVWLYLSLCGRLVVLERETGVKAERRKKFVFVMLTDVEWLLLLSSSPLIFSTRSFLSTPKFILHVWRFIKEVC